LQITNIRNIAIIAHVDHGKTTLVDQMLKQCGTFRANQVVEDRIMDNNALERERGITILAKNTSIFWHDTKINIVDTPGHADFSGEVERVLKMVNGVLLLVDSFEGPMPQTRFVLQKAMELNHKIIIVINKTDRPDARSEDVALEVLGLLTELSASETQLDSPIIYCSARQGIASLDPNHLGDDLEPLFDMIVEHIPPAEGDPDQPLQLLVSAVDYNDYTGRMGIGRIENGIIYANRDVAVTSYDSDDGPKIHRISSLFSIEGLQRRAVEQASAGDIICFSGIDNINIGQTLCDTEHINPLPFVKVGEPTMEMLFSVNDSPFAGREGKYVTSRHLRDRLYRELLKDVSLKVLDTDSPDCFSVLGRGEMHLSILIETMRRQGYEFAVSPPKVIIHEKNGHKYEPTERLHIDVPEEYLGHVMEKMGERKGVLISMTPAGKRIKAEFVIPSRSLFGYRNEFLTDTKGEGIMGSVFYEYQEYKGDINRREYGALTAFETGTAVTYGLYNAQERGMLFIEPGTAVYEGMIVGQNPKNEDIAVNVCKKKQVSNMRASGSDETLRLIPPKKMSLEQCLEFLADDELMEVTPQNLRLRKRVLSTNLRLKQASYKK